MKRFLLIGFCLFGFTSFCMAETVYVAELMSVALRSGRRTENKIISMIKSGEKVEVIQNVDGWAKVRSESGKEGWLLQRYLTTEMPIRPALEDLKTKYQALSEIYDAKNKSFTAMEVENTRLQSVIAEKERQINEIREQYKTLKTDSSDFLSVKNELGAAFEELSKAKIKTGELEKEIAGIQNDRILKGLLIGTGILLLGMLIGITFKKQRRRSSLLLS